LLFYPRRLQENFIYGHEGTKTLRLVCLGHKGTKSFLLLPRRHKDTKDVFYGHEGTKNLQISLKMKKYGQCYLSGQPVWLGKKPYGKKVG
jgi:hypothetical protein